VAGWVCATSWQLCVLVAAVAAVELLLGPRSWPELRAGLWWLVMLKLVLPPSLEAPWSLARLGALGPGSAPGAEGGAAVPGGPRTLWAWAFWAWAAGAGGILAVALARHRAFACRLLAGARRAPPELQALLASLAGRLSSRRPPEVLVARGLPQALVLGFLRPTVVVGQALAEPVGSAELEHVLLHELAHCRRRDPLQGLVCLVLRAAFWFHPLVWWAAARLSALREQCCDQVAVRALGGDPSTYRQTLLRQAEHLLHAAPAGVHAFGHPRSVLLQRLVLLGRRSRLGRTPRALVAFAVTLLVAIASVPHGASASSAADRASALWAPPPAAAPRALSLADLGCLQRRFVVLAALAEHEARTDANQGPPIK
jgi:beta-lactamase regulating signal transducer with metallopeptidase domain